MNILEKYCKQSDCYKKGEYIKPQGLMIHSVGVPQPDHNVFFKNWNKAGTNACAHAVIGVDGTVLQLLPWTMRGWHAGGSANNTHIGVEMVEPSCIKYISGSKWELKNGHTLQEVNDFAVKTYNTAVELFAFLCKEHGINPLAKNAIISHKGGNALGVASNHGDVEHIWDKVGLTLQGFREDINKAMQSSGEYKPENSNTDIDKPVTGVVMYRVRKSWEDKNSQIGAYTMLQNAKTCADNHSGYKVFDEAGKVIYESKRLTEVSDTSENKTVLYRVRILWDDSSTQVGAFYELENAKRCAESNRDTKVFDENGKAVYPVEAEDKTGASNNSGVVTAPAFVPYRVKILTSALNIRREPNGEVVRVIRDNGVYTIVEEKNGWGRLASGAGWILISDKKLVTRLN